MAIKSKLELIMELGDKLFNNKLTQVQSKLGGATDQMESKLKKFNLTQIKIFSNFGETFKPERINQAFELFESVSEKLDFTKDIKKTELALRQMDVKNIEEVSAKINEISKVFNADSIEVAKAANAMTKQIGGSFESNLALLQSGYEKGADLNGDMLDQFKEYGPQIRELGLDASQMLAIMARAGKDGLFSDKAIDSIKEANLSLKEMGPAQMDALKGIGIDFEKDLKDKTSFQAVQLISQAMNGATAQAKQLALTDIFKGAGEDAGMGFILGLGTMDLDPNNLESFQAADAFMNTWLANFQSKIASSLGSLPIQDIGSLAMTVMGLTSLMSTLNGVLSFTSIKLGIVTAAQWLWNIAMNNLPLLAIISLVVLAIAKFDDWGAGLMLVGSIALGVFGSFMAPITAVILVLKTLYDHWDSIKQAFQSEGILGGLKRIGIVLMDAILKPLQQIFEFFGIDSWASKIEEFRTGLDLVKPGENEPKNPVPVSPYPEDPFLKHNQYGASPNPNPVPKTTLLGAPVLDGKVKDTKTKKEGEKVTKAVGQANQIRKIDIKIDAFNKGGINVAQSAYAGMTKDDVEAWFKEMLRRVVINAETA